MTKLIGFDTETVRDTNNVHRFFSFQAYSEDFENMRVFSLDANDIEKLLTRKTNRAWFVCFNLSFDGMVVSRMLQGKGYKVDACFAGSRIIRLTVRRNDLKWVFMWKR